MISFTREYGLSHADLHRILPRFEGASIVDSLNSYALTFCGGRDIVLVLGPEQERRLGRMRIPYVQLQFAFHGWEQSGVDAFMGRFDRMFHKGGG
ncbi:MAG: hypothetical protein EXR86_02755 [Gammaproteobacteria bacterium]|nr:hypothetical protein [Gammaproteobacteria bacterium]